MSGEKLPCVTFSVYIRERAKVLNYFNIEEKSTSSPTGRLKDNRDKGGAKHLFWGEGVVLNWPYFGSKEGKASLCTCQKLSMLVHNITLKGVSETCYFLPKYVAVWKLLKPKH